MRKLFFIFTLAIGTALFMPTSLPAQHLSADGAPQTFQFVSDQYFSDVYFHFSPTAGTSAGLHQYDTQLEDYTAAGIKLNLLPAGVVEREIEHLAIGSGVVEGAAKTLGLRLKARGARWRHKNARVMAALVCVRQGPEWERFWNRAA